MKQMTVRGPDGRAYTLEAPDDASPADAEAEVSRRLGYPAQGRQPSPSQQQAASPDGSSLSAALPRALGALGTAGRAAGAVDRAGHDFVQGVGRGLAGDVLGAGQIAGDLMPDWLARAVAPAVRPAADRVRQFAEAPASGWAERAGRVVGGAVPAAALGPETVAGQLGADALAGSLQPTDSGSLASHAGGAALGAGLGAVLGAPFRGAGERAARDAMAGLGVRTPPEASSWLGRGALWLGDKIGLGAGQAGRQASLQDFNQALYARALEPLGIRPGSAAWDATVGQKVGSEGLDALRRTISSRLDAALRGASLPPGQAQDLLTSLDAIRARAAQSLGGDALGRLDAILDSEVRGIVGPARRAGGLGGERLASIVSTLNTRARAASRGDAQDRALGQTLREVEDAVVGAAQFGTEADRAAYQAARQSYARYRTLLRAGSGVRADGMIDPDSLSRALRSENRDLFSTGRMGLSGVARDARAAGVPPVASVRTPPSTWPPPAPSAQSVLRTRPLHPTLPALAATAGGQANPLSLFLDQPPPFRAETGPPPTYRDGPY